MRLSRQEFLDSPEKSVTLLGMSGVGKTRLASVLREENWFHYSVDYRIGTRYLDEPILDNIKSLAMEVPFLRELLLSDSIYISNNVTFDNLKPLSTFLGKVGDPEQGGFALKEFKRRQLLHLAAEVKATMDMSSFIDKARNIYGYQHFLNDVSGSFCEIDDESVYASVAEKSLVLYLEASEKDELYLMDRAARAPKPLYYREAFLDEQLGVYLKDKGLEYISLVNPDDFVRWVFPRLFHSRVPRYKNIADTYGYTVPAQAALEVTNSSEFIDLVSSALT